MKFTRTDAAKSVRMILPIWKRCSCLFNHKSTPLFPDPPVQPVRMWSPMYASAIAFWILQMTFVESLKRHKIRGWARKLACQFRDLSQKLILFSKKLLAQLSLLYVTRIVVRVMLLCLPTRHSTIVTWTSSFIFGANHSKSCHPLSCLPGNEDEQLKIYYPMHSFMICYN